MHFLAFVGMRCPLSRWQGGPLWLPSDGKADRYGFSVARRTAMARFSSPGILFSAKEEASSLVAKVPTARMRGFLCHSGRPCQKSTITVSLANQKPRAAPPDGRAAMGDGTSRLTRRWGGKDGEGG